MKVTKKFELQQTVFYTYIIISIQKQQVTKKCGIFADCSVDSLALVSNGQCSMADLRPKGPRVRLGLLPVGKLHHWHFCQPCIALDLVVQFKL